MRRKLVAACIKTTKLLTVKFNDKISPLNWASPSFHVIRGQCKENAEHTNAKHVMNSFETNKNLFNNRCLVNENEYFEQ